jgi:Family of unknown function (DUF6508)
VTDHDIEAILMSAPPAQWQALIAATDDFRVDRVVQALSDMGAIVPFDWGSWDGAQRYRDPATFDAAPVCDAVRFVTAVVRSDRFNEGAINARIADGTFTAALRRLRRWYETERTLP